MKNYILPAYTYSLLASSSRHLTWTRSIIPGIIHSRTVQLLLNHFHGFVNLPSKPFLIIFCFPETIKPTDILARQLDRL